MASKIHILELEVRFKVARGKSTARIVEILEDALDRAFQEDDFMDHIEVAESSSRHLVVP